MPTCQNCEEFVTEKYVRIFCPEEQDDPKACPHCEDLKRVGSEIREKGSYGDVELDDI